MKVRMEDEIASPGVHDGGDAEQGAQPFRIAARAAGWFRQAAANSRSRRSASCSRTSGRSSAGSVNTTWKWRTGSARCHARRDPARLSQGLALGAMAIAARVVDHALAAAVGADVAMSAERAGAADRDVPQRPALHRAERSGFCETRPRDAGTGLRCHGQTRRPRPPCRRGTRRVPTPSVSVLGGVPSCALSAPSRGVTRALAARPRLRCRAQRVERTGHAGQVLRRHLQIPGGVANRPVPEQHLDGAQVLARLRAGAWRRSGGRRAWSRDDAMPSSAAAQWTARRTVSGHNGLSALGPGTAAAPAVASSRQYSRSASSSRRGSVTRRGRSPLPWRTWMSPALPSMSRVSSARISEMRRPVP